MKSRIEKSIAILQAFSAKLDDMDHEHYSYAKSIKNELFTRKSFEPLYNIFKSKTMHADSKFEIASHLFRLSLRYLVNDVYADPAYVALLDEPMKKLENAFTTIDKSVDFWDRKGVVPPYSKIGDKQPKIERRKGKKKG